jgi:predicted Zn-dependent protease
MLVRDRHFDRAERVLSQVDPDAPGVDLETYHTLRGLLLLKRAAYAPAVEAFEAAIAHGQHDDSVFVYLAQCHYGLKDWERTVQSVVNAQEEAHKHPDLFMMRAEAEIELGRRGRAWGALAEGARRFPDVHGFARQQTFLLIDMGLFQEATERGLAYLDAVEPRAQDHVALAVAFDAGGQRDRAVELLELARLRFPDDPLVLRHLARRHLEAGRPLAAADLLARGVELDAALARESADIFKNAGAFERALYMNTRQPDQRAKLEQRVAILLDQGRFEEVATLDARLERVGALEDQRVLYALAYAKFKAGELDQVEPYLKRIRDPELFEHATGLRRVIAVCSRDPRQCG